MTNHLRSLWTVISLPAMLLLCSVTPFGQSPQDIEPQRIVNTIPSKVPIKIEFINGGMKSALEDIEIRVTNIGKKSIYYLGLNVSSEKDFQYRHGVGFADFQIGNRSFSDFSRPFATLEAERSETTPFKPGDVIVLQISKKQAELSWKLMMDYGYARDSRLKLCMSILRFEDGTGFATPQAVEMPEARLR